MMYFCPNCHKVQHINHWRFHEDEYGSTIVCSHCCAMYEEEELFEYIGENIPAIDLITQYRLGYEGRIPLFMLNPDIPDWITESLCHKCFEILSITDDYSEIYWDGRGKDDNPPLIVTGYEGFSQIEQEGLLLLCSKLHRVITGNKHSTSILGLKVYEIPGCKEFIVVQVTDTLNDIYDYEQ